MLRFWTQSAVFYVQRSVSFGNNSFVSKYVRNDAFKQSLDFVLAVHVFSEMKYKCILANITCNQSCFLYLVLSIHL